MANNFPSNAFLEANGVYQTPEPEPERPVFTPSTRFLEANGVYDSPAPEPAPAPAPAPFQPSTRFLEANGVYDTPDPAPAPFQPSTRFLEANGVYQTPAPQPEPFQPSTAFLEANGVYQQPVRPAAFQPSTHFLEINGVLPTGQDGLRAYDVPLPEMPEPRYEEIDAFILAADNVKNVRRFWFDDSRTGETVVDALAGESELETLTAEEQAYMATQATAHWVETENDEAILEAHFETEEQPNVRRILDIAYAGYTAAAEDPESYPSMQLFALVQQSNPGVLLQSFEGKEADLAGRLQNWWQTSDSQTPFLEAALSEDVSQESAAAFGDAMFFHTSKNESWDDNYTGALAALMARGAITNGSPMVEQEMRAALETRLADVFSSSGGEDLLFSDEIHPALRQWAGAQVISDEGWTANALDGGWESDLVGQTYAQSVVDGYGQDGVRQFAANPDDPETIRTAIGFALQMEPDALSVQSEADLAAFLENGMSQQAFGENDRIDTIAGRIQDIAGPDAIVTAVPVTVTSNDFGAMVDFVFKVENQQGETFFLDSQGRRDYKGLSKWTGQNELPPGRMHFAEDMEPGGEIVSDVTPSVTDTFWEWVGKVGDTAALGVGIVAGVAIVVGTGGTAALVAAGAAGVWGAGRAAGEIIDDATHGVNVWDPSDSQNRANWLNFAAGALSVAAIGGGLRAASATQNGARMTGAGAQALARINFAANLADGAAMTDQTLQLALNWNDMSPEDRAMGLMNLAFWGGMTVASTNAAQGQVQNAFNYRALSNDVSYAAGAMQAAHGHPNEMVVRNSASPIRLSQTEIDRIAALPPEQRPDPSTYIPQDQIDAHLDMFADGAARTTTISTYEKYGTVAAGDDVFVMPQSAVIEIIGQSNGDIAYIEGALGLPLGHLSNGDVGIALISSPPDLAVPSGREEGANEFWEPGGLTSGYVPEAVISQPNSSDVRVVPIDDLVAAAQNGTIDTLIQGEPVTAPFVPDRLLMPLDETTARAAANAYDAAEGGHVVSRHGPEIPDAVLEARVLTGIAPDGKVSPSRYSARFSSYTDLVTTREAALTSIQQETGFDLSQPWHPPMLGSYKITLDHGRPIDEGFFVPAGVPRNDQPHPNGGGSTVKAWESADPVDGITATFTHVKWNADNNAWEVVQHYPLVKGWDQASQSYPGGTD